jgi:hypothetical protein
MKVNISVTWVGVFLVVSAIIILTLRGIDVFRIIFPSSEGFASKADFSEDLHLSSCPADSKSYIDDGGRSICCNGTIIDGKCVGTQVCSLSEKVGNLPTCDVWFGAYLDEKGSKRCPPSMPHYYENLKKGVKGCTAGNRVKDGTAPALANDKSCKLYNSKDDDLIKIDSCTNQRLLEESQCFTNHVGGTSKQFNDWGPVPPPISCSRFDTSSMMPLNCINDNTFIRTIEYWIEKNGLTQYKNWREDSIKWNPQWKLQFCSVIQKLNIDKSIEFKNLDSLKVF